MSELIDIPFEPGIYHIFNKANGLPVSRNLFEDASLNPKKVLTLDKGLLPRLSKWEFKKLPNGNFILSVGGSNDNTANIDGFVFAVLQDEPKPTEWKIERARQQGEHSYVILEADKSDKGWQIPKQAPETQIEVKPLVVYETFPPSYPYNEVFIIERVKH